MSAYHIVRGPTKGIPAQVSTTSQARRGERCQQEKVKQSPNHFPKLLRLLPSKLLITELGLVVLDIVEVVVPTLVDADTCIDIIGGTAACDRVRSNQAS